MTGDKVWSYGICAYSLVTWIKFGMYFPTRSGFRCVELIFFNRSTRARISQASTLNKGKFGAYKHGMGARQPRGIVVERHIDARERNSRDATLQSDIATLCSLEAVVDDIQQHTLNLPNAEGFQELARMNSLPW